MKKTALVAILKFIAQGHNILIRLQKMPSERLLDLADRIAKDTEFPSEISSYEVISNYIYCVREIHQVKEILVWFKIQEYQDSIVKKALLKKRKRILVTRHLGKI